jgi:hypothetical protein
MSEQMLINDFSDFIMPEIETFTEFPDGEYVSQVTGLGFKDNQYYGRYSYVVWNFIRPFDFEGKTLEERFKINHPDDKIRHINIKKFATFCADIGGLAKGEVPSENKFIFKTANILIRNNEGKNGGKYPNIVRYQLVDKALHAQCAPVNAAFDAAAAQYGVVPAIGAGLQPSGEPLNDEVPF